MRFNGIRKCNYIVSNAENFTLINNKLTDNAGHLICCFGNKTSIFTLSHYGIDVEHVEMK